VSQKTLLPTDCAPFSAAPKRKRIRQYIPGEWKRRNRFDPRSMSRKVGRPPQKFLWVTDSAERKRMVRTAADQSPSIVARAWLHESMTRSKAEVLSQASIDAYTDWCESLDDEWPAGFDLSAALWG